MAEIGIRAVRAHDLRAIADAMRAADLAELRRATDLLPHRALVRAVTVSDQAWCATVDHVPACLFGVAPGSGFGIPWLLGTDLVATHARELLRLAPAMLAGWRARYGELHNLVDAQNAQAIRWLRRMGATLEPPVAWGVAGDPFLPFRL